MAEKINYKRRRDWSEMGYLFYRIFTNGTLIAFMAMAFLVLLAQFNTQYHLLNNAETAYNQAGKKDFVDQSNNLISSIGNNASLIITFLGVVLVIITLLSQTASTRKNGFKNNFFEFLKIHRSNVEQINTKGKAGHDAFIAMYQELLEIIPMIENEKLPLKPKQLCAIAYLAFFWGIGPTSSAVLKDSLLKNYQLTSDFIDQMISHLESAKTKRDQSLPCILDGHQSDLGHYFRHLYQTVTFISNERSLWYFEKYYYGKTLRAQFSNHELAIFLFNANSPLGRNWEPEKSSPEKKLISYYALVKNVPPSLVTRLDIRNTYPSVSFEFDE